MRAAILLFLVLLAPLAVYAQDPTSAPATTADAAAPADLLPADVGPVAVPEPTELALQRYRSGSILWAVNQVWGLLIPALFLFTGWSARIRTWAAGKAPRLGHWYITIALYFIIFTIANAVISLPLEFYQTYIRDHAYGLSNQTLAKWTQDALIGLGVGLAFGLALIWIPYLLLKKSPRRWWLYTAALVPPVLFLQMMIWPVYIDPLFNKFDAMQDKALEAEILSLAERAGIEGSRVYEVNKSVDTKTVNAYVTGFAGSKRIVLWDTLLAKLEKDEVLFIMGHEMGHYVLNHVTRTILFISVVMLVALYLIHRLSGALIVRYRQRWGFDSLADIASLPLIMLMMGVFSLIVMPLILALSRHHEHEADRFGIELTRLNRPAATGFVKLQEQNLGVPWHGWLYTLWRDTHPTIGQRITFFNEYKPWDTGGEVVYGELFED